MFFPFKSNKIFTTTYLLVCLFYPLHFFSLTNPSPIYTIFVVVVLIKYSRFSYRTKKIEEKKNKKKKHKNGCIYILFCP